ncbi:MAG: hypothetical protein ACHQFZ_00155 [Acidimicrobiales bacterium]
MLAVGAVGTMVMFGAGAVAQAAVRAPVGQHHAVAAHAAKAKPKVKKVAFKGTYTGKIALLWSDSSVAASIATGTGTGTYLGSSTLAGKGTSPTASYCDNIIGTGSLSGGGSKLSLSVLSTSKSQACVPGGTTSGPQSPPTTVTVTGTAKVLSGTGKWKGVSGTLSFKGSFAVSDSTAGTNESDTFTVTLTGTLSVKS